MGSLAELASKRVFHLRVETTVGRSAHCGLHVQGSYVSSVHATIRFAASVWEIKDLGSTNGTFVNGSRLGVGAMRRLQAGDVVSFGAVDSGWKLLDEAPPSPMALADDGEVIVAEQQMLAIPSSSRPAVTIYCTARGGWSRDQANVSEEIRDGESLDILGRRWRVFLPDSVTRTDVARAKDVRSVTLIFDVSSDEEDIRLLAEINGGSIDLGNRASNLLLLVLARRYLADVESGLAPRDCGWVYPDELSRALRTDAEHVNVDIFRVRRRFAPHFDNAAEIIERQNGSRRLRVNAQRIEVRRR